MERYAPSRPDRARGLASAPAEDPLGSAVLPRMPAAPLFRCGDIPRTDADRLSAADIAARMGALAAGDGMWRHTPIGESDGVVFERFYGIEAYTGKRRQHAAREIPALCHAAEADRQGLIFVTAGHHAVESAGPLAAVEFAARLQRSGSRAASFLRMHYDLCVVPIVDVDNFARPYKQRTYSTLNNFYHLLDPGEEYEREGCVFHGCRAGPEARAVAGAVMERLRDGDRFLSFDLHEAWNEPHNGFFLVQSYETRETGLAREALRRMAQRGLPVEPPRTEGGYPPKSFSAFTEFLGGVSFTLESPRFLRAENGRVKKLASAARAEMHLRAIDAIVTGFLRLEADRSGAAPGRVREREFSEAYEKCLGLRPRTPF